MKRKGSSIGQKGDTSLNVEHRYTPGDMFVSDNAVLLVTGVDTHSSYNGHDNVSYVTCLCSFYGGKDTRVETYDLLSSPPPNSWWTKHKVT